MENIITIKPIRSKRKVLTQQQEPVKTKIIKQKKKSKSLPKLKKRIVNLIEDKEINNLSNLTELNLLSLYENNEEYSPSTRKPNYLEKSIFLKGIKALTPKNEYKRKNLESPICQYYDNSPIIKKNDKKNNNFSFFLQNNKIEEKKEIKEINKIDELDENNIIEFNNDSSDNEEEGNKFSSFVKEVIINNCKQEENYNNNYNEDNNNNIFIKTPKQNYMNVNININNNSNNNIYYQFNKNEISQFNNYNNNNIINNNINNNYNNNILFSNYYSPPQKRKQNINLYPSFYYQLNNYYYSIQNNFRSNSLNNNKNIFSKKNKKIANQNYTTLSNEKLSKQAHIIAKYQSGSRYLQKKIEEDNNLVNTLFFPNILGYLDDLCKDQYGHLFVIKISHYLNEERLLQFIAIIYPVIQNIAFNQYGTKVLEELINLLNTNKLLSSFIKIIYPYIINLIFDPNSMNIIIKLLLINNDLIKPIHQIIYFNIIIKKYIEIINNNYLNLLIQSIQNNIIHIINDQYGNYIIQLIILMDNQQIKSGIINFIIQNICMLSNQKFSSNVIERCLEDSYIKNQIIDSLLIQNNFQIILFDIFGNYVIQKAISVSDNQRKEKFFQILIPLIPQLQNLSFGQKLLSKILLQNPKLAMYMLNLNP